MPTRSALPFVLLGVLLVAPWVAFGPSLHAGFVWDDRDLIVESPALATLQPVARFFRGDFWSQGGAPRQSGYYRPLTLLSYALQRAASGLDPMPFHAGNLLLHGVATLLVLGLARTLGANPAAAAVVAFLWCVHPAHAESVAWISGRTDVLATTFALAALLCCTPGRSVAWLPVASLLLFAGLLCKESCAALPLLVLVPAFGPLAHRVRSWAALVVAMGAYATLRLQAMGPPGLPASDPLQERAGDAGRLLVAYAVKVLWPVALPLDHVVPSAGTLLPAFALLLLALPAAAVALAWRGRLEGVGLLLYWLGLLPSLGLVPIHEKSAIRFLYLPLLGLLLAVAPSAERLLRRLPRPAAGALLALPLVATGWLSIQRSRDFASDETLFRAERRLSPRSQRMALNLGETLRRQGRHGEVVRYLEEVRREGLDVPEVNVALVRSLREAGDLEGSAREGKRVVEAFPSHGPAHAEMGLTLLMQGYPALARERMEKALELDPDAIPPRANLALLFARNRRFDEALAVLAPGLARHPQSRELLAVKGHALHRAGRHREALPILEALAAQHPDHVEYWLEFADVAFALGMYETSRHASTMARTLVPKDTRPPMQLARLSMAEGRIDDAEANLRRVLELAPDDGEARLSLVTLLWQSGDQAGARRELSEGRRRSPSHRGLQALEARLAAPAAPPVGISDGRE